MNAPRFTAVLPAKIRARWDRLALEQLAQRAVELDADNEDLAAKLYCADNRADFWEEQVRRAEDDGAQFALTQDGQIYRLSNDGRATGAEH